MHRRHSCAKRSAECMFLLQPDARFHTRWTRRGSGPVTGCPILATVVFWSRSRFMLLYVVTDVERIASTGSSKVPRKGRAMFQVVSRQPFTAEARVRARVNPCGICGGQSSAGTGFYPSSSVFPCQYHSNVALQTHHLGNA
jgi:hypothetical protein